MINFDQMRMKIALQFRTIYYARIFLCVGVVRIVRIIIIYMTAVIVIGLRQRQKTAISAAHVRLWI